MELQTNNLRISLLNATKNFFSTFSYILIFVVVLSKNVISLYFNLIAGNVSFIFAFYNFIAQLEISLWAFFCHDTVLFIQSTVVAVKIKYDSVLAFFEFNRINMQVLSNRFETCVHWLLVYVFWHNNLLFFLSKSSSFKKLM